MDITTAYGRNIQPTVIKTFTWGGEIILCCFRFLSFCCLLWAWCALFFFTHKILFTFLFFASSFWRNMSSTLCQSCGRSNNRDLQSKDAHDQMTKEAYNCLECLTTIVFPTHFDLKQGVQEGLQVLLFWICACLRNVIRIHSISLMFAGALYSKRKIHTIQQNRFLLHEIHWK